MYLENAAADDERWQHSARMAAQLGVVSSMSLHVPTDIEEVAASLNLSATRPLGIDGQPR